MKIATLFMVCLLLVSCQFPSSAQADSVEVIVHELDSGEVNIIEVPGVINPEADGINMDDPKEAFGFLLENFELIFGFIVILFGYISRKVPGLKKIKSSTYRILTLAIIVGLGAWLFGFASIWQLTLTYALSTSFYQVLLKPIKRTPKPEPTLEEVKEKALQAASLLKRMEASQ